MALVLNGSGHLSRLSGLVTDTGTFTLLYAVKLTGTQTGTRTLTSARPADDSTDYNVTLYDPGYGGDESPIFQGDYGSTNIDLGVLLTVGSWDWLALTINAGTATSYFWNGSSWTSGTAAQTNFALAKFYMGDAGAGTARVTCKFAAIREWNAVLNTTELTTEKNSITAVRASNLVSAKRGVGADLTACLLGETGTTFTANGTVTVDSDEPTFTAQAEVTLNQTASNFTNSFAVSTVNNAVMTSTVADFSNNFVVGAQAFVSLSQTWDDFSTAITADPWHSVIMSTTVEDFPLTILGPSEPEDDAFYLTQTIQDFNWTFRAQKAAAAVTPPVYSSVSCGPGETGSPVRGGANIRRESHRRWPTK